MLKKLFKALTTLALLVGCYFGYVHAFALVVEQLRASKRTENFAFEIHASNSRQESIRYAIEACGANHWAADKDLAYRYYNAERRYWIYAKDCKRIVEENGVQYNGKRLRLTPFLLISKSSDGKSTKTITSDVAVFDLNEALSFNVSSSAEPLKIKHARLEPNVWVRDDKGTPGDASDDMKIGPLTTVDYEESTQQITTQLDTYVVVEDPELSATGYGMVMQLRKTEAVAPGGSAGFEGVERLDLLKNVHVVMRDVGKSGLMAGTGPTKKSATGKGQAKAEVVLGTDLKTAQAAAPVEPTPLDLRCDSKMQVYLPKPRIEVAVGPPPPPAPTLVQFDRNVVVLRGRPDERPDQLTCDTLKLSMIPGEKPVPNGAPAAASGPKQGVAPSDEVLVQSGADARDDAETKTGGDTAAKTGNDESQGALGGLTLQRVHATGHAVWLHLPAQGIKLVCNELIHVRQLPYKPDQTYFRGDSTRRLQLEKVDVVQEEGPDHGKIMSVTTIVTVDATLFDGGFGMDATNVVAHGPGRLETRPDRDKPVERIAVWQDRLIVQNELGADHELVHKIIDLVGNRPCFIDNLQKTSLDSGSWIQVWLKPQKASPPATDAGTSLAAVAGNGRTGNRDVVPLSTASAERTNRLRADGDQSASEQRGSNAGMGGGMGGGGLRVEKLHARVDVHLLAPARTMTARDRLDAEFVDAEVVKVAANAPAKDNTASPNAADNSNPFPAPGDVAAEADQAQPQGQEQVAAQNQPEEPEAEPPMVGSCDRMWARITMQPKAESDKALNNGSAKTKTASAGSGPGEMNAEIRLVWMWGNVALHQGPKKGKDKKEASGEKNGQFASGEALYLDNRGTNKAISYVYQRDPAEKTYLPGPLPPARVETDDLKIAAAGMIQMNQGTDQAWVHGPGTLTQMAARGFLSEKSSGKPGNDEPASDPRDGNSVAGAGSPDAKVRTRTTSFIAQNGAADASTPYRDKGAEPKPATRAGRPTGEKVPMTIGFSQNMEFTGRSVDPEGRPAAMAEFYGIVTAQMEDALLHCTEKMIAYTDREVPLAQLGKMTQGQSQGKADDNADNADGDAKTQAELTLLFCYRNAVAISRKVDPDAPILVQQQRIEAVDLLAYDRRTGDFFVPGKGKVYLYDRSTDSSQTPEPTPDGNENRTSTDNARLTPTQRTVSTTSGRPPQRRGTDAGARATETKSTSKRQGGQTKQEKPGENLPLTLIQVHFNKGMRGQFGSGGENDKTERCWSEFYGDVESARAKVASRWTTFDFDRLPGDAMFLTAQTLLVTQEPPPVASPKSAPSRYHMKAWEKVYTTSNDKVLQSDVMTYDSQKDLIYAYGKDGHNVNFAEQHAAGQPISPGSAKAVQLNPKTGGLNIIDSSNILMIDKNTGIRPSAAKPIDPFDKKAKPAKKPFKLPTMNIERRGFTGQ